MPSRGYIRVTTSKGVAPYEEFNIDSYHVVRFLLQEEIDGTTAAKDISQASTKVYFRISPVGSATVPVDVELDKTNGGADGIVDGEAAVRSADFTAGTYAEAGVYVVNTGVSDALTPSGFKEYLWGNLWQVYIKSEIDAT